MELSNRSGLFNLMPRYFFHLHNDIDAIDEEGRDLADLAEARHCAEHDALHMAAESVRNGKLDLTHSVEVSDEAGLSLLSVTFGEVVTIIGESHARPPPAIPNPAQ